MTEMPISERLGRNVRAVRAWRGISAKDFAAMLGTSPSHVSIIESGKTNVQLSTLAAMAHALGVQPATLVADWGFPPMPEVEGDTGTTGGAP